MKIDNPARIRSALGTWFDGHARDLPWRRTRDPWHILLSEIILQQTRVHQGLPYYERFVKAFPTPERMAAASLDDVLFLWEGLGYYSRARNLHRTAGIIANELGGRVPETKKGLLELPGIGPYTAAAVASIAFGEAAGVLDGNVIRVLSRLFMVDGDVARAGTRRTLQGLADELVHPERPGRHNEAMMELGATVCTPTGPRCDVCPVSGDCRAFDEGNPEAYPVKRARARTPHYDIAVGVIQRPDGRLLIQKRPEGAMLGGLWEFPGGKTEEGEGPREACRREVMEETGLEVEVGDKITEIRHAYSHFRITLHAFRCRWSGAPTPEPAPSAPAGVPTPESPAAPAGAPTPADPAAPAGVPTPADPAAPTPTNPAPPPPESPSPPDAPERRWVARETLADYAFPRANRRLIEQLETDEAIDADRATG